LARRLALLILTLWLMSILVFVIGSPSPRLRQFRDAAGKPLRKTWITVVAEPFAAVLLGILAAITQTQTSGTGHALTVGC